MFKLIVIIAVLCLAFDEQVRGESSEASCDDECNGGATIQFSIDVAGGANCDEDDAAPEEEIVEEDTCLGSKNSKRISKALLKVLHGNGDLYQVLLDLKIIDFMYDLLSYQEFADHIKESDLDYEGFARLKKLVTKFKVCKKVCKVYFQLRKTLRDHAANAQLNENANDNEQTVITVTGDLILYDDVREELENYIKDRQNVVAVNFEATTFILDSSMRQSVWHGKHVNFKAENFIVPREVMINVAGLRGESSGF